MSTHAHEPSPRPHWRPLAVNIVSPAVLTFALFFALIFAVLIPAMERNIIDRKKEMIRELTQVAMSELASLQEQEARGALTTATAQQAAIDRLRAMRYGPSGKDYFWITDMQTRMVMHPYRPDLNGKDLSGYADPNGKRLFGEHTAVVREKGEGYVDYLWQWNDDDQRVVPKLSYVKEFTPWGWIVGTGVYLGDVQAEIHRMIRQTLQISVGISALIAALLIYSSQQALKLERERWRAETALRASEEKYRLLLEGTTEGVLLVLQDRPVFANQPLLDRLGYTGEELARRPLDQIVSSISPGGPPGPHAERRAKMVHQNGQSSEVLLAATPVTLGDQTGQVLTVKDISTHRTTDVALHPQPHAIGTLLGEIQDAASPEALRHTHAKLPLLLKALIEGGARVDSLTGILTTVSDAILVRLITLAEAGLGPPPAPYAFVVMGSEAREEQTLATDQDNALIYADVPPEQTDAAQGYFLQLGATVCSGLDLIGYRRCPGDVMASNRKWCRPLAQWRQYFADCVTAGSPQDLLDLNVFVDLRCAHGEPAHVRQLRDHLHALLEGRGRDAFFFHLAQSTLQFRAPRGFFGNIRLESSPDHPAAFNVKAAIVPLVNFARIYALRNRFPETNTLQRFQQLRDHGLLLPSSHDELTQAYTALMQMRLTHQLAQISRGTDPDNLIDLQELTQLERSMLKRIFADIAVFQARLQTDFARTA